MGEEVGVSVGRAESIRLGLCTGDGDCRNDNARGEEGGLHRLVACVKGGGEPLEDDGREDEGEGEGVV